MSNKKHAFLRNLIFLLLFCMLAGALLFYTDGVLWDKSSTVMGFYEEPENSLDVVYVGGSHSNAAISPIQIYNRHGYTGYVMYSWSQPIWTSYHYVKEALKTQTPKVVVLDTFGLVYNHTYISDVDINSVSDQYSLLIPPSFNRLRLAMAMSRCQTNHLPFYRYASLLQYHNRWKALTREDFLWPLTNWRSSNKGYGPLYTTEAFDAVVNPDSLAANDLMESSCMEYLNKFIQLSKEEGFELVLVSLPYVATEEELGIYARAKEICMQNNVSFVDYYDPATLAECGFDWNTDMAEHAHVNFRGAHKITRHLGDWLKDHFDLPDHRGDPAYAQWQIDLEKELRDEKRMDLKLSTKPDELFGHLLDSDYTAVVLTRGDLSAGNNTALQAVFAENGLDTTVFSEPGFGLSVLQNGKLQQTTSAKMGASPLSVQLTGEGWQLDAQTSGDEISVLLNGKSVALDRDGVHFIVIDTKTGELIQKLCFDANENYSAFTD